MRKLYSGKLIVPYGVLVILFAMLFNYIEPVYLKGNCLADPATNYPIDEHVYKTWCFFDAGYVRTEGLTCYDVSGYFRSFFPLDIVFPVVYSLLMLSIVELWAVKWSRKILIFSIIAGALADYLEDFSFALFLKTHANAFAGLTAFFTTLKTCLLIFNGICCIEILLRWAGITVRNKWLKPSQKGGMP
jgi:hypothetical protein